MHTQRYREVRGNVLRHPHTNVSFVAAPLIHILAAALLIIVVSLPAAAQGPEGYGAPHLFALPTATTTRQFAMGGVTTPLEDIGFANPAFAGMLKEQKAAVRVSCTEFDGGLELTGTHIWYATPIGADQGIQIVGFNLDSDHGTMMSPLGALEGTIEETDLAVHYGRRLSDRWLVGAGISPILDSKMRVLNPASGEVVSFSESDATFGFRIGALYQYADEGFAGFVFDHYTEDVMFQAPSMPVPQKFDFTSTEWALGVSGRLGERIIGVIEWMELKSKDGGFKAKTEGLHLGLEYEATAEVALRVGSNDGGLSLGAGYEHRGWVANYAYINDWNDDAIGAAFGGSDTHQLEIGRVW